MCVFINPIFTMLIINLCPKGILYAILLMPLSMFQHSQHTWKNEGILYAILSMPLGVFQHSQHAWKNEFLWFSSSLWQQRKEKRIIYIYIYIT